MGSEPAVIEMTEDLPPPVVVAAIDPKEEETTEGFVLDVLEDDDDDKKSKEFSELSSTERLKVYDENKFLGKPMTEEEHIADQSSLSTKISNVLSWLFIAFLFAVIIGVLVWHFTSKQS